MARVPLQHSETDHPRFCWVSVCQPDKWPVRDCCDLSAFSLYFSSSLLLSSGLHSLLAVSFSVCLPSRLPLFLPSLPLLLFLFWVSSAFLLLQLIESSLPQRALILANTAQSATQASGCSQFRSCCVSAIILATSRSLSPSCLCRPNLLQLALLLLLTLTCLTSRPSFLSHIISKNCSVPFQVSLRSYISLLAAFTVFSFTSHSVCSLTASTNYFLSASSPLPLAVKLCHLLLIPFGFSTNLSSQSAA